MNYLRTAAFLFLITATVGCTNRTPKSEPVSGDDNGTAVITFAEAEHHLGQLTEGEKAGCFFKYRNSGTGPLIITSAATSCGCTVPRFDKKPLAPGDSGIIEVIFDTSGREGFQAKTITVQSNSEPPVMVLKITAEVKSRNNQNN